MILDVEKLKRLFKNEHSTTLRLRAAAVYFAKQTYALF